MITPILSDDHKQTAEWLEDSDLLSTLDAAVELFAILHRKRLPDVRTVDLWIDNSGTNRIRYTAELQHYIDSIHREYLIRLSRDRMLFEGVLRNRAKPNEQLSKLKRFPVSGRPVQLSWPQAVHDSHKAYLIRRNPGYYKLRFDVYRDKPLEFVFPSKRGNA